MRHPHRQLPHPLHRARSLAVVAAACVPLVTLVAPGRPLHAQPRERRPTVTDVSPRALNPGQTVTITGTNLQVPGYSTELLYKPKYEGTTMRSLTLSGSATVLTFQPPADLRPDSLLLQFREVDRSTAANNPVPTDRLLIPLPRIDVRKAPEMRKEQIGAPVTSDYGIPFVVMAGRELRIAGRNLLRTPQPSLGPTLSPAALERTVERVTSAAAAAQVTGPTQLFLAPTVQFAGNTLTVTSARYVPGARDEVTVTLPELPHNTTGTLSLDNGNGRDTLLLTYARPPRIDQLLTPQRTSASQAPLEEGKTYLLAGANLRVRQQVGQMRKSQIPEVTFTGRGFRIDRADLASEDDSTVYFKLRRNTGGANPDQGTVTLSHPGGQSSGPSVTAITAAPAFDVSGATVDPQEVIGGTRVTVRASLNPTPTDFQRAGALRVTISPSLASVIADPGRIPIQANPVQFDLPVAEVTTTTRGNLIVAHQSGGLSQRVEVTVRPPHPTSLKVAADTVSGGLPSSGSVEFDREGGATVFLASSDPSVLTVPPSVRRTAGAVAFPITTSAVTAPRAVTITAALDGTTATRTIQVVPGRLTSFTSAATSVLAGETFETTITWDAPVTNARLEVVRSDTTVTPSSAAGNGFTGTTLRLRFKMLDTVSTARPVTFTVSSNGSSRSLTVQVVPNPAVQPQFTASATSGPPGSTIPLTLRLGRPATSGRAVTIVNSDPSVVDVRGFTFFQVGEDTKVLTLTFVPGQTVSRSAQVTVRVHRGDNTNDPVTFTATLTFTVRP